MTLAFLADENISPETADYLAALGYPCYSLRRDGPWQLTDREIVRLARQQGRIIITHDLDFGETYYLAEKGQVGMLVLRLHHQTVEMVNDVLQRFLQSGAITEERLKKSLVVVSETTYRIYQGPCGAF